MDSLCVTVNKSYETRDEPTVQITVLVALERELDYCFHSLSPNTPTSNPIIPGFTLDCMTDMQCFESTHWHLTVSFGCWIKNQKFCECKQFPVLQLPTLRINLNRTRELNLLSQFKILFYYICIYACFLTHLVKETIVPETICSIFDTL